MSESANCSQPGFDVDETRLETVSSDRSFRRWHVGILLQVVGVLMSVDPMLRDDVEQWSRVEDVQQWFEYRALWNAEQYRRRYRLLAALHDLLRASTEKRPDAVEHSVPSANRDLKLDAVAGSPPTCPADWAVRPFACLPPSACPTCVSKRME